MRLIGIILIIIYVLNLILLDSKYNLFCTIDIAHRDRMTERTQGNDIENMRSEDFEEGEPDFVSEAVN